MKMSYVEVGGIGSSNRHLHYATTPYFSRLCCIMESERCDSPSVADPWWSRRLAGGFSDLPTLKERRRDADATKLRTPFSCHDWLTESKSLVNIAA